MNGAVVIDAGFAFRLVLPGPDQAGLQALAAEWLKNGISLIAPALWGYEVTSALTKAVHFGALTPEEGRQALGLAYALDVQLVAPDEEQAAAAYEWTLRMGRAAAYDSFYLALAESLGCELWTADRRLQAAASRPWVRVPQGHQ